MTESPSKRARPPANRNSIALAEVGTSILHRSNTSFVCWPCSNAETMHFGLILLKNSVSQRGWSKQQNTLLPNSLFANVVFRTGTHENSVPGFSDDFRLLEFFNTIGPRETFFSLVCVRVAGSAERTFAAAAKSNYQLTIDQNSSEKQAFLSPVRIRRILYSKLLNRCKASHPIGIDFISCKIPMFKERIFVPSHQLCFARSSTNHQQRTWPIKTEGDVTV